jgi:hypothetical protein
MGRPVSERFGTTAPEDTETLNTPRVAIGVRQDLAARVTSFLARIWFPDGLSEPR